MPIQLFKKHTPLQKLIKKYRSENEKMTLLSVCSPDGFSIACDNDNSENVTSDKISAMASSISSICNSAAKTTLNNNSEIITVEAKSGNMLIVVGNYKGKPCVISMTTKIELSIAQARFLIKRFVGELPLLK